MIKENMMLSADERKEFISLLKGRFFGNPLRHESIEWSGVERKIIDNPGKLDILYRMEMTGGEPDVISYDEATDEYTFTDCSAESPKERRSLCYDREALDKRKTNKPADSAVEMAAKIGIEILSEDQYRELQNYGEFDLKTSSWVRTPEKIRKLGGAIFCDRRYNTVFTYHNGADSYYSSRGFRGYLKV